MSDLTEMFKEIGLTQEQVSTLVQKFTQNPLEAVQAIKDLNIPPEKMQQIAFSFMQNPDQFKNLAKKFGVDENLVDSIKNKITENKN